MFGPGNEKKVSLGVLHVTTGIAYLSRSFDVNGQVNREKID